MLQRLVALALVSLTVAITGCAAEEPEEDVGAIEEQEQPLSSSCSAPTGETRTIRVLTINLRHDSDQWERRFALIADEIVRLDPDIIGVQEVELFDFQAQRLSDLIAARRADRRNPYNVYRKNKTGMAFFGGEGIAIYSKFSSDGKESRDLGEGRVVQAVRLKVGRGRIDFLNTHLHAGGGDEGHDIRRRQAANVVDLSNDIGGCYTALLTGDMNARDGSPAIAAYAAGGFQDSYKAIHGADSGNEGNTQPVRLAEGAFEQNPRARIDYVFSRPGKAGRAIRPTTSKVYFKNHDAKGFYPSDHFGVMTTFTVKL